jgi:chromosome segregation ATPase
MQQMGKEKKTKKELEQKIMALESKVFERRQRLGEYNALFMSLDGAAERAPRQRLGAREAVSGTKRIIEINLHKLQSELAAQGMKLNRARDRNLHLREKVDLLRKEHITFRKLFGHMGGELDELKEKIKGASWGGGRAPQGASWRVGRARAAVLSHQPTFTTAPAFRALLLQWCARPSRRATTRATRPRRT